MKKLLTQATVGLLVGGAILSAVAGGPDTPAPMVTPGLYVGVGGGYNSFYVRRSTDANQRTVGTALVTQTSDTSNNTNSKFAPMAQLGYWAPIDDEWLWGLQATYKYLNYTIDDLYTGQILAASNTGVGLHERTSVNNELLLLAYGGVHFDKGYAYLGLGAAMFTVRDWVGPVAGGATATNLFGINTFVNLFRATRTQWGGALQVGYNYYFKPTWFMGVNYTFAMTGTYSQTVSQAGSTFTGANATATNINNVVHSVQLEVQEFMFSINKVFEL